jgi:hypothetical protein
MLIATHEILRVNLRKTLYVTGLLIHSEESVWNPKINFLM